MLLIQRIYKEQLKPSLLHTIPFPVVAHHPFIIGHRTSVIVMFLPLHYIFRDICEDVFILRCELYNVVKDMLL